MEAYYKVLSELMIIIALAIGFGGGYSLAFALGCCVEWFLGLEV